MQASLRFHYINFRKALVVGLLVMLGTLITTSGIYWLEKHAAGIHGIDNMYRAWNSTLALHFVLLHLYAFYVCAAAYSEHFGLSQSLSITRKTYYSSLMILYGIITFSISIYFILGIIIQNMIRDGFSVHSLLDHNVSGIFLSLLAFFANYLSILAIINIITLFTYRQGKVFSWLSVGTTLAIYLLPIGELRNKIFTWLSYFFGTSMLQFHDYQAIMTNVKFALIKLVLSAALFFIGWLSFRKMPVKGC